MQNYNFQGLCSVHSELWHGVMGSFSSLVFIVKYSAMKV